MQNHESINSKIININRNNLNNFNIDLIDSIRNVIGIKLISLNSDTTNTNLKNIIMTINDYNLKDLYLDSKYKKSYFSDFKYIDGKINSHCNNSFHDLKIDPDCYNFNPILPVLNKLEFDFFKIDSNIINSINDQIDDTDINIKISIYSMNAKFTMQ
jgi:hypothetical protein